MSIVKSDKRFEVYINLYCWAKDKAVPEDPVKYDFSVQVNGLRWSLATETRFRRA